MFYPQIIADGRGFFGFTQLLQEALARQRSITIDDIYPQIIADEHGFFSWFYAIVIGGVGLTTQYPYC